MVTIIEEKPGDNEGSPLVDKRDVKRKNQWTSIVQLSRQPSEEQPKTVALENTNYVNTQIRNSDGTTTPIPTSAVGNVRVNLPQSNTNTILSTKPKEETYTAKIKARRSGGGTKATSRGAK
jgi:hypothetical protein